MQRRKAPGRQRKPKGDIEGDSVSGPVLPKTEPPREQRVQRRELSKGRQEVPNAEPPDDAVKKRRSRVRKRKGDEVETGEGTAAEGRSSEAQQWSRYPKYVGAHMSIQGGIWNAVLEAERIGARALGLFIGSQRTWKSKALDEKVAEKFRETCSELGFKPQYILPHSPYIMNLGSPKPDVLEKSRSLLVDQLSKCQQLGLIMYNIHPGSNVGSMPIADCLGRIADGINLAHAQVPGVTVVLENMSCQGSTVGGLFPELRGIIDRVTDKSRIGVCLDTCHAFAAGHDLAQEEGLNHMLEQFSQIVGLRYLKAIHLNDSKGAVGCRLDRHENIGRGQIGLEGFRRVMNEPRLNGIPMILETPYSSDFEDHSKEIGLLYSLCAESESE